MPRVVAISDTHNRAYRLDVPEGDILIFSGDATNGGSATELEDFFRQVQHLDFEDKIFVAGNHDFCLEKLLNGMIPSDWTYLSDGTVDVQGLKIFGSPFTPQFGGWAFMESRDALGNRWQKIPDDVDVVVTHGPPQGILDQVREDKPGCRALRNRIVKLNPKVHIFGHIHEAYGAKWTPYCDTLFVNASCWNHHNDTINPAWVLDIGDTVDVISINHSRNG